MFLKVFQKQRQWNHSHPIRVLQSALQPIFTPYLLYILATCQNCFDVSWFSSSNILILYSCAFFYLFFLNQDDMETIDSNELRDSGLEKSKHSRKENMSFWYKFPTFLRLKQNDSWDWDRFWDWERFLGFRLRPFTRTQTVFHTIALPSWPIPLSLSPNFFPDHNSHQSVYLCIHAEVFPVIRSKHWSSKFVKRTMIYTERSLFCTCLRF